MVDVGTCDINKVRQFSKSCLFQVKCDFSSHRKGLLTRGGSGGRGQLSVHRSGIAEVTDETD